MSQNSKWSGVYDLHSYNYDLPEELIAQVPAEPRDASRLLVWRIANNMGHKIEHKVFSDVVDYLRPGDLLVLNDTRVLPMRLQGIIESSKKINNKNINNESNVEILLLNTESKNNFNKWRALVRPARRLKTGSKVLVGDHVLIIEGEEDDGIRIVNININNSDNINNKENVFYFLHEHGIMPLPPYIKNFNSLSARQRYQTIFATNDGSAAAPTAGLHFTEELLKRIEKNNIKIARITLHVGLDTFRPVRALDIRQHKIHSEYCEIPVETEIAVKECRAHGGRVVAVGTTVVRALESMAVENKVENKIYNGLVKSGFMDTKLFIYPGFVYQVVDALITNFHLPESSLLMLVSAFINHLNGGHKEQASFELLFKIYSIAILEKYRFFSFGDAMYIEKQ